MWNRNLSLGSWEKNTEKLDTFWMSKELPTMQMGNTQGYPRPPCRAGLTWEGRASRSPWEQRGISNSAG